jgi:hypothetical protein
LAVFGLICWAVYFFINLIGPPASEPDTTGDDVEQFNAARRVMVYELRRYLLIGLTILIGVGVAVLYAVYCLRAPVSWSSRSNRTKRRDAPDRDARRGRGDEERSNTIHVDPNTLEDWTE